MPGPGLVAGDKRISDIERLPPAGSQLKEGKEKEARQRQGGGSPLHCVAQHGVWLITQVSYGVQVRVLNDSSSRHIRRDAGLHPGHRIADAFSSNAFPRRSHCLTLGFPTCLP